MTESVMERLNFKRKLMLSAGEAGCGPPVVFWLRATQSRAQPQTAATTSAVYGVASIRPSQFGPGGMLSWDFVPDGFMAKNVTLRMPIQRAYGVEDYQISSVVKWLGSDAYNIEAKVDASVAERLRKVTREQRRIEQQPMLQHLLAERWKLELYDETKELPVYALVIAKGGLKMQEAKPGDSDANAIKSRGNVVRPGNMEFGWGLLRGRVVSIAYLARMLSRQQLGRPVVDKTGLKGTSGTTWAETGIAKSARRYSCYRPC